ncbi:MAG: siderophore biosynthesis protein SbnG [Chloroflexi bacterium]|nr:siderophore biosynthesis protein SbnG [Chloroflexota bacterium]
MGQNKAKAKLAEGKRIFGYLMPGHAPDIVEAAAEAGLDYVMMDGEHGTVEPGSIEEMVRAAEVVGVAPFARVPVNREEVILRFMDRGLVGVMIPHVSTAEDARAAVAAIKFSPHGMRGMSRGRWTLAYRGEENVFAAANRETLVICMVEDQEAIDNLDGILAVPGVDVIQIGTSDLSQSLGYPGQVRHPRVQEAVERIVRRVRSRPGPFPAVGVGGLGPANADLLKAYDGMGARFINIPLAGLLTLATRRFVQEMGG